MVLPRAAYATCSQSFSFSTDRIQFSFDRNYGGKRRGGRFINDIKELLPSILGMDESLRTLNQFVHLHIGCQQHGKAYLEVLGMEGREVDCRNESPHSVIKMLCEQLGLSVNSTPAFEGYTLQIAYGRGIDTSSQELQRWERVITDKDYFSSLHIVGDCEHTPVWIHQYPDGYYGIRFGIFGTF